MEKEGETAPTVKKKRGPRYAIILIIILALSFVVFFIAQIHAVHSISVELTELKTQSSFLSFSAEIKIRIHNRGIFSVSLSKATVTLFMNGINVQTKGFETELLVINPNDYNVYTVTMVTFDSEDISELQGAQEFDVVLELVAEARSLWYSSAIKTTDEGTWA